ncbi:MAG TPA: hypothetical protein PLX97_07940, partial [Gemmatales bacterium]|nr:hypothetical protein [Gemmatales bacterium]
MTGLLHGSAPRTFTLGLLVVARGTKRLPVSGLVPEQFLVPLVGDDVVHHRRFGDVAFLLTLDAQRVGRKEGGAGGPPPGAVAPLSCAGPRGGRGLGLGGPRRL